jgi:predicted cupin superfamily sugar epimerase
MSLTPEEIKALLHLERHPTCGFVAPTYRSTTIVPRASLSSEYGSARPIGSALYFLVTPDAQIVMHRIRSDQQYHHYLGDPLDLVMLLPDGSGRLATVGSDLRAGMVPQLFIPGGTFHMARLRAEGRFALLGSTEWPGVDPEDVEHGNRERLMTAYPAWKVQINEFMSDRA